MKIMNAGMAAMNHAATGGHGGCLSPVSFIIAVLILCAVIVMVSVILQFFSKGEDKKIAKEMRKELLIILFALSIAFEVVLCLCAGFGLIPWIGIY